MQFGWTGADLALPGEDTVWTASAAKLDATKPVTAVLGQRAGTDLPDHPGDRRQLHADGDPGGGECRGQGGDGAAVDADPAGVHAGDVGVLCSARGHGGRRRRHAEGDHVFLREIGRGEVARWRRVLGADGGGMVRDHGQVLAGGSGAGSGGPYDGGVESYEGRASRLPGRADGGGADGGGSGGGGGQHRAGVRGGEGGPAAGAVRGDRHPGLHLCGGLGLVLVHDEAVLPRAGLAEPGVRQFRPGDHGDDGGVEGGVLSAGQPLLPVDEQDEASGAEDDGHAGAVQGGAGEAAIRDDAALQGGKGESGERLPAAAVADSGVLFALQGDRHHHRDAAGAVLRLDP